MFFKWQFWKIFQLLYMICVCSHIYVDLGIFEKVKKVVHFGCWFLYTIVMEGQIGIVPKPT